MVRWGMEWWGCDGDGILVTAKIAGLTLMPQVMLDHCVAVSFLRCNVCHRQLLQPVFASFLGADSKLDR